MSLKLNSSGGGSVTLQEPVTASARTLTLPNEDGTVLTTATTTGINATALSTGTVDRARLPVGSVLQVGSTTKTDVFSTTSTSFTDITGFSVTLTPTSSSSKFLVQVVANVANSGADAVMIQLVRGSTAICIGDAAGSRIRASASNMFTSSSMSSTAVNFLDSPATASAVTYKVQMRLNSGTGYLNRSGADTDNAAHPRTASTITVMEIAG
jgi:hypothetical protein